MQLNKGNIPLVLGWLGTILLAYHILFFNSPTFFSILQDENNILVLETGEGIWPNDILLANWKLEMFAHATSPIVWNAYLGM